MLFFHAQRVKKKVQRKKAIYREKKRKKV